MNTLQVAARRKKSPECATKDPPEFLEALRRGDERAWQALMRRHEAQFICVIQPIISDPEGIEDVLQDGYLKAHRGIGEFDNLEASIATWVTKIMRRAAINRVRNTNKKKMLRMGVDDEGKNIEYTSDVPDTLDAAMQREQITLIESARRSLMPKYQDVINVWMTPGMTYEKAGKHFGISFKAYKSLLDRARKSLSILLQENGVLNGHDVA